MKKILLLIVAITAFFLPGNNAFSNTITAIATGNWENGSTWSGGKQPQCGDSVVIGAGNTIQVTSLLDFSTCGNAMYFQVSGTLNFQTDKKIKFPAGTKVEVTIGGLLSAEKVSGNINSIEICNVTVWNAEKGNLNGPVTLQLNPLPVDLVHFSAKPGNEGIILSWVTSSELNNAGFTIEKSKDGITFTKLGKIKGVGTSAHMSTYKFIDKTPTAGLQFYRLSQKDFNGTTKVMNPITIRWNHNPDFNVYPNPSKGELYANVASSLNKQIGLLMITNQNGNVVVSKDISFREKTKAVTLVRSSERLLPGNYMVNIICNGNLYSQDVMVQ